MARHRSSPASQQQWLARQPAVFEMNGDSFPPVDEASTIVEDEGVPEQPTSASREALAAPPKPFKAGLDESTLRHAILHINNDQSLSGPEKARKIQELMSANWAPKRTVSPASSADGRSGASSRNSLFSLTEELGTLTVLTVDLEPSFYVAPASSSDEHVRAQGSAQPILGCRHYRRSCKILADCCQKWFSCRFCHDETSDHLINRFATKFMLCMLCRSPQRANQVCGSCSSPMARYYCNVCRFWDDDPDKPLYHCEQCGICRVGRREDYIHCSKCNACLALSAERPHKCIERSLECDCPICGEYMFNSISPVMFMPCGHAIHYRCHRDHTLNSYQCPICCKSLGNMTEYFRRLDEMMATHQMPPEYERVRARILCNDCDQKSVARFHFLYHKCALCSSYNTKLINTFNVDADKQDGVGSGSPRPAEPEAEGNASQQ